MREIVAMPIDKKPFGHMDAGEIIREYNAALEKRKQIDILADLNCCTRKEMARWLDDQGCDVDVRYLGGRRAMERVFANVGDAGAVADPGEEPVKAEEPEQAAEPEQTSEPAQQEPAPDPAEEPAPQTMIAPDTHTDDQAAKHDAGKPMLSLVPPEIIYAIARVRQYGCEKYHDPDNWRKVSIERYWDAVLRHVLRAWWNPEAVDDESGLLHIEHVACNLAFILEMMREEKENECNADR